jgi:hypothetical protein
MQFSADSASYRLLIDISSDIVHLTTADIDRLYCLLDYGEMSTIHRFGAADVDSEQWFALNLANIPIYGGHNLATEGEEVELYPATHSLSMSIN